MRDLNKTFNEKLSYWLYVEIVISIVGILGIVFSVWSTLNEMYGQIELTPLIILYIIIGLFMIWRLVAISLLNSCLNKIIKNP